MKSLNLSGFVSAAEQTLRSQQAIQVRKNAEEARTRAEFAQKAADINDAFKPLVDALTSLPPGKDGKRFRADIFHLYPTELVVAYIGEDWKLMTSSPAMGKRGARDGFVIKGKEPDFTVEDMTSLDHHSLYKTTYNCSAEKALTVIGGILPKIAPERTQEIVAAITQAYGGNSARANDQPKPSM